MQSTKTSAILSLLAAVVLAAGCLRPPPPDPGEVAAAYAAAGRYEEAAREIELALRTHPNRTSLRRQAAEIYAETGELEKAIAHLEVGIQLAPRDAEMWITLGELENRRENVADAYVAYRRAAEIDGDDIRAVSGLALAADTLGFDEEANRAYERWAELERAQKERP